MFVFYLFFCHIREQKKETAPVKVSSLGIIVTYIFHKLEATYTRVVPLMYA